MQQSPPADEPDDARNEPTRAHASQTFWRRLLHRWFVEYNPFYLFSSVLVLAGTFLTSRGLADDGSVYGQLAVASIAELYSAALIGGAAILMRVGQRRSAVMVALLTVLYQADLTLHTESCVNLGTVGVFATGAWLAIFVVKLHALAWAVKIRLTRETLATAALGAAGLAVLPYLLGRFDSRGATALVALWLAALSALFPRSTAPAHDEVYATSLVGLDAWGRTVFGRAVRATWVLWSGLLGLHVVFWSLHFPLRLGTLAFVLSLVATRLLRSEGRTWLVIVAILAFVGAVDPSAFSTTAFVAAGVLAQRAWATAYAPRSVTGTTSPSTRDPYRALGGDDPPEVIEISVVDDGGAAVRRLAVGAVFASYLSVWTLSWVGGHWPAHSVPLDIALTMALVLGASKWRTRIGIAPLGASWLHFALSAGLVPRPHTAMAWGGSAIASGFALLVVSLAVSYRLRRKEDGDLPPSNRALS